MESIASKILLAKISDHVRKYKLLQLCAERLQERFDLTPCVGVEIEFYLNQSTLITGLKKEKGAGQYEIDIMPHTNMLLLIDKIDSTKLQLSKSYPDISFHPRPYDDYGSAMHFHINFLTSDGRNYFDDPKHLDHVASSLCHYLLPTFMVFAPDASHYTRYHYHGMMAPTHVAYGSNNRTVAIRIPDQVPKRLEHRIASPEIDAHLVLFAILQSIYLGLLYPQQIQRYSKIYGNAYEKQYDLQTLPHSLNEAYAIFKEDFFYDTEFYTQTTLPP